jgi:hypothetical protein
MKYIKNFNSEAEYNAFLEGSDYITPNVSYIAETNKVEYSKIMGVYVQHINGKIYTLENWSLGGYANEEANGVVAATAKAAFVIAKNDISRYAWMPTYSGAVTNLPELSKSAALEDYNGYSNTQLIVAYNEDSAAKKCQEYTFPNGKSGYLPSMGELNIAAENFNAINEALSAIGGTALGYSSTYWSSNQYAGNFHFAWAYRLQDKYINDSNKTTSWYLRPFTTL